ncbi:uncharacterized protein KIAA1143 homolog [Planococcus citri]|uniref:uncharacterized protein KIAA1143 homolog n=1 Tax=Planococcus citri TaxID=170843 RepID=UPI0031F9EC92
MSKRNVVFSKPDEPLFLKKLKQQIGYCEGPTVDTKRERRSFSDAEDSDNDEKLDDQPTIVVLNPGDLSADQVEAEKKKDKLAIQDTCISFSSSTKYSTRFRYRKTRIMEEKETAAANLNDRIIFKPSKKKEEASKSKDDPKKSSEKSKSQPKAQSKLLSFDDEEDQDE